MMKNMLSLLQKSVLLSCMICFFQCSAEIRKELRSISENEEVLVQSGSSIRSSRIDPSRVVQLSWQPRVFVYRGFVSDEECHHLISLASKKIKSVVGNTEGVNSTSLVNLEDEVVAKVEEKISAWTLLPLRHSRPVQVEHHANEAENLKYDFYGNTSDWQLSSEPLMATVILCLSNTSRGGEISFPESQIKTSRESRLKSKLWPYSGSHNNLLKPVKGNTILFFSVHPNASPDKNSHHERSAVTEGEMWSAIKIFHLRAVNGIKVPSKPENSDCTDEDESCQQWAALGECQRNPVFMVGSPDYYGTCRKSCRAC